MGRINYLIVLIVIVSTINQSFSAVRYQFVRIRKRNVDYQRSKSASSHRGLLLSYSPEKIIDICNDLFPPTTPTETLTSGRPISSDASVAESAHQRAITDSLFKATIVTVGKSRVNEEGIFFTCFGYRTFRNGAKEGCMLSSAFRPGFMYAAFRAKRKNGDKQRMRIRGYIAMSPEYVELDHEQLETRYVSIRRRLKALASEYSDYNQLIQTKHDLSELTTWQLYILCESIVSSPIYQQEGIKFVTDRKRFNFKSPYLLWKPMAFRNKAYSEESITFQCVICKATRTIENIETSANLYVTQSYDNKNSVYVLKVEDERITLDKYFIKVPILMNAHDSTIVEHT